jgi:hypothetical protein
MDGIQVTAGGTKLIFATTGEVADASGADPVVKGKWQSDTTAKDNTLTYTIDDGAQKSIAAVYSFTSDNQLSVALKGDATSDAFVFPGSVEVDKDHDFLYHLIDETGADTGVEFTIYGTYEFEEVSNDLVLHLAGGGDAHIEGDTGAQSLEAARNHLANFKGEDLLTYQATTTNTFSDGTVVNKPAILNFIGSWDIKNGTVVFQSEIQGSQGKESVTLGFGGKFAGVTAGFIYHHDPDSDDIALNISGQHTFRSDRATTNLAWDTSIGFSANTFSAKVHATSTTNFANGQKLAVTGTLDIEHGAAKPLTIDLTLEATYSFQGGTLVFKADIKEGGPQPSYDLMLQGNFVYDNLKITFTADFGSAAGGPDINVSVGIEGNKQSMIQNIQLILKVNPSGAAAQLSLSFSARLHFVNGQRVIEQTAAAAASAAPAPPQQEQN